MIYEIAMKRDSGRIVGTVEPGPAEGLVRIVGGRQNIYHHYDMVFGWVSEKEIKSLYPRWPHKTVELGKWDWRRLFGQTTELVPEREWRLPDTPVDFIVPICEIERMWRVE